MRLFARMGLMVAGLLLVPFAVEAKPPRAALDDAGVKPGTDLNEILRKDGWTVLELPSNIYQPGKLFRPGSSSSQGTCVDATPITGELPNVEASGTKGFVTEIGAKGGKAGASVGVKATSFKLKSSTEVEQAVIEGMDMQLNEKCTKHLQGLLARGTNLDGWVVVQETVRARVREVKCSSQEAIAQVQALWIVRGEVGEMSDCVQSTEVTGVIAYKAMPVTDLVPGLAGALMPDSKPVESPPPPSALSLPSDGSSGEHLSMGIWHTCGVSRSGAVKCWGNDGLTWPEPPNGAFTSVSAGGSHTCGVLRSGRVKCWGESRTGESRSTPPSGTFSSLSAGRYHTCGVLRSGVVECWGKNGDYQSTAPSGAFTSVSAGGSHTCGVLRSGAVKCWGETDVKSYLSTTTDWHGLSAPSGPFTSVSAGLLHTCGVLRSGRVKCWGDDVTGQSTAPSGTFTSVSAGWYHTCGVLRSGAVKCWGDNSKGQSTAPSGPFTSVSAGKNGVCGVLQSGAVKCWGHNEYTEGRPPPDLRIATY
jgi:hypothetical protein